MYLSSCFLAIFAMTSFYLSFLIYKAISGTDKYPIALWTIINAIILSAYLITSIFSVGFAYGFGFVCLFSTILYGLVVPAVSLFLPDDAKIFAIVTPFIGLPFAVIGLFLHVLSIYTCWFFVGYFALPALIGTCWFIATDIFNNVKGKKEIKNELVQ